MGTNCQGAALYVCYEHFKKDMFSIDHQGFSHDGNKPLVFYLSSHTVVFQDKA